MGKSTKPNQSLKRLQNPSNQEQVYKFLPNHEHAYKTKPIINKSTKSNKLWTSLQIPTNHEQDSKRASRELLEAFASVGEEKQKKYQSVNEQIHPALN